LKFTPNNTKAPILEVGKRMIPGNDQTHFCQPADVAVLKNGDFFVADGYCNSRIVKFDKNGQFLTEWSSEDEGMPAHFFVPHALALHETKSLLCVADRENFRVQCFDLNGNYLHETKSSEFGPMYSVAFASNNASVLYAVNGFNSRDSVQYDKKVFLISIKTGNVMGSINLNEDVKTPHDLSVSDDSSEIYIADLNPPAVHKYVLVNYNLGNLNRLRNQSNLVVVNKGKIDGDKDNFRTSMFIMGFLVVPVVIVIIIGLIVRCKNMGKLNRLNTLSSNLESKQKDLGKWLDKKVKKRKGFTRLNQDSDNEEIEKLNKPSSNGNLANESSDAESDEIEISLPQLSKA
jgi:hypothetical protein